MKSILLILLLFTICLVPALAQKNSPQRFHYNVSGRIMDEKSNPVPNLIVCLIPSRHPINGREPCVKTDNEGKYSVGDYNIPDKYEITASNSESLFIVTNGNFRAVNSKPFVFKAKDENNKINLLLKPFR